MSVRRSSITYPLSLIEILKPSPELNSQRIEMRLEMESGNNLTIQIDIGALGKLIGGVIPGGILMVYDTRPMVFQTLKPVLETLNTPLYIGVTMSDLRILQKLDWRSHLDSVQISLSNLNQYWPCGHLNFSVHTLGIGDLSFHELSSVLYLVNRLGLEINTLFLKVKAESVPEFEHEIDAQGRLIEQQMHLLKIRSCNIWFHPPIQAGRVMTLFPRSVPSQCTWLRFAILAGSSSEPSLLSEFKVMQGKLLSQGLLVNLFSDKKALGMFDLRYNYRVLFFRQSKGPFNAITSDLRRYLLSFYTL